MPAADLPPVWISPSGADRLARLARWCETVGPVFYQPKPSSVSSGPVDRLAIVSWNIRDREPAVRALRNAFPGTPSADRGPTWTGPLGLRASLDHVFVRGAVSAAPVTRLPGRFGSDRFPC